MSWLEEPVSTTTEAAPCRPCSRPRPRRVPAVLAGFMAASGMLSPAFAGRPSAAAVTTWDAYTAATEQRIDRELARGAPFLVQDIVAPGQGTHTRSGPPKPGIFVMAMPAATSGGRPIETDDALIHHWLGSVFVPGVTIGDVLGFVRDYDNNGRYFEDVVASRRLSNNGDVYRIFLKLKRTKVITVYYNTEHPVVYSVPNGDRASSRSVATKIAELEDVGTGTEYEKTPDKERGFMWRLNSYWRFLAVPGGVIVECESTSMSRSIPTGLGWLVGHYVKSIPRESLERTLTGIKRGVLARAGKAE
jgi:hypothetical protein